MKANEDTDTLEFPLDAQERSTPRPWKASFVRWTKDAPIIGFAIRPADQDTLLAKRGVSIASQGCSEPHISAAAMYPDGELEANAALIVRSVNSADAAEKLYDSAKRFLYIADRDTDECNALRAAIVEYEKAKETA